MNFFKALLALGVRKLLFIIELDGIIIASIMGLDVIDVIEGDMASVIGLVIDIIGLVLIMGLVEDIIGLVIGLVEDIIGLVADIIGLVVIIGLVDIMGPANPMDIIRREFNMFSANLDIMDKTVRIMGDVVII